MLFANRCGGGFGFGALLGDDADGIGNDFPLVPAPRSERQLRAKHEAE